ncbi:MAG: J domain-containing protein, partial [Geopsychrobacter sp.]|nr:J domain-containing protein [Geopsychrobacter sp.]
MTYKEFQAALTAFDLPPQTTWKKVRQRHRQLVHRYHPDKGEHADEEQIRRINAAYKILNEY